MVYKNCSDEYKIFNDSRINDLLQLVDIIHVKIFVLRKKHYEKEKEK